MVDSEEPRKTVRLPDLDTKRTVIIRPGQENEADAGQPILTGFLVSYSLSRQGQFFPLREGRQTIGKGQSMRIKINDALLSEEHALILCRGGKFIFEDRLSSNGSVVNGQEVNGQVVLQHGDFLTLGAHSYTLVVVPKSELSKS
jgi:pSer/pThr/pTyr-binding forkhead associated (FHA) protein